MSGFACCQDEKCQRKQLFLWRILFKGMNFLFLPCNCTLVSLFSFCFCFGYLTILQEIAWGVHHHIRCFLSFFPCSFISRLVFDLCYIHMHLCYLWESCWTLNFGLKSLVSLSIWTHDYLIEIFEHGHLLLVFKY